MKTKTHRLTVQVEDIWWVVEICDVNSDGEIDHVGNDAKCLCRGRQYFFACNTF